MELSDQELRYYNELFQMCDVDSNQKVTRAKATELFIASGLQPDILHQITELCGAQRLGHFGRSQFYIALKLIAAAQSGLPTKLESFNAGKEIPLPVFNKQTDQEPRTTPVQQGFNQPKSEIDKSSGQQPAGQLPPPPKHSRGSTRERPVGPGGVIPSTAAVPPPAATGVEVHSNPVQSPQPLQPQPAKPESPNTTKTPVQSPPLSPNSQHKAPQTNDSYNNATQDGGTQLEKGWASFEDRNEQDQDIQGLISHDDVDHGGKQWARFSSDASSNKLDSSDVNSSDTDSVEDIWMISDEQKEYYVKQFRTLQPDLNGVILGAVAKDFFEKSKLPNDVLSKIWRLSDVNKDGALSLEEFCTAMHLVVLRRNEIELPDSLPPSLMPYTTLTDEPFNLDLPPGSTIKRPTPTSPSPQQPNQQDSKIIHPVALRMSPDGHLVDDRGRTQSEPSPYDPSAAASTASNAAAPHEANQESLVSPTRGRSQTESFLHSPPLDTNPPSKLTGPLQGRPRPTPKKAQPVQGHAPGPGAQPLLQPPPHQQHSVDTSTDSKPKVVRTLSTSIPKRGPVYGHFRSQSLDYRSLQRAKTADSLGPLAPPPAVPPRGPNKESLPKKLVNQMSEPAVLSAIETDTHVNHVETQRRTVSLDHPQMGTDDITEEEQEHSGGGLNATVKADIGTKVRSLSPPTASAIREEMNHKAKKARDKREIQAAIRQQRMNNMQFQRLNGELNQELQEVMEQRIALEIQLEHLRPFSNT
ncbi:ralBP1-associated Eps domain-containing protein 1 isoform X2 [Lingula anatina]|uniref:RalBP1-associated Eps domain-containing protein 1 isoform X2 n=1 Tax=Lingula anatina TaxID=7574 RepID=A0A1S3JZL1_LINAN|nr:ralBP1-associated Eps domain-containing protein 1 isoform X2 [Lingula anatina]|eukprot:XP_013415466.1 ralBP1-associated Eps domain-containing protein 1 isoform X2 [Lingula anatina]